MTAIKQTTMFVFPGQGSQYRGMGSDLHAEFAVARRVYERASEVVGYDMAELSFRDPENLLDKTEYTQPALLTHSIACLEVFQELSGGITPDVVAGHSLGEYSALVAARVLTLESAVALVRRRGQLMSQHGQGEMVALTADLETVRPFAERHYCGIGGCNLPNQTVVGGQAPDIEAFVQAITATNPRLRPTKLRTEGAFHTYLMVRAAQEFRVALDAAELAEPAARVLSNYTGDFYEPGTESIKYKLFYQLFHPVRWIWSMQRALTSGVTSIFEFGGGVGGGETPAERRPNLAGIIQRTIRAREGRFGRRADDVKTLTAEPVYLPAINSSTVVQAAHVGRSLQRLHEQASAAHGCQLFVPSREGIPLASALDVLGKVDKLGLGAAVELVAQPEQDNVDVLTRVAGGAQQAQPYLQKGPDANAVTIGPELEAELASLSSSRAS